MSKLGRNPFEPTPPRQAPATGTVLKAKSRKSKKEATLKKAERLADDIRFSKREKARERAMKSVTPCALTKLAADAVAETVVFGIKAFLVAREIISGRA